MGAQALCLPVSLRVCLSVCWGEPAASGGLYVLEPETGETGTQGQGLGGQYLTPVAGGTHTACMYVCASVCLH